MKKFSVALPVDLYEAVAEKARQSGASISDVVRDTLAKDFAIKPHQTIGEVAMDAIRAGATNQQALAHVRETFPDSNTSSASIAWYRMTLRKAGEDVLSNQEAKIAAKWP